MADTYTQNGKVRKIEQSAYTGGWAARINDDAIELLDDMIAGTQAINLGVSTSYALGSLANGTDSESRAMTLTFTGTPASPVTVTVPSSVTSKLYLVKNDCGQLLTIKYSATSGVTISASERAFVYADGTTVFTVATITVDVVGQLLNNRTDAEIAGSVTPVNYAYKAYHASRYGFSSTASASVNTSAIQQASNALSHALTSKTTADGYGALTYTGPVLDIPDGVYDINDTITLPAFCVIRANKVILNQTDATKDHFSSSAPYRVDIEGISFHGGKRAYYGTGPNTDTSRVRFSRCEFHTGNSSNYAIVVDTQTCNTLIEDCLILNSPLFLDVDGDYAEIRDCWVNGYLASSGAKPDNTASVNNRARYMRVSGGSWVPQSVSSVGTRWFNNQGGLLSIDDVQFGSEGGGGIPIVYEYGTCVDAVSPYTNISGAMIRNCQLASGPSGRSDRGVIVLQGAVPSIMEVRGGQYVIFGKVISDAGFSSPTIAGWLQSNIPGTNNKFSCLVENVGQEPTSDIIAESVPPALMPFARIIIGVRGDNPGKRVGGPINYPVTEYNPSWLGKQALALSAVCGRNGNPTASTYFNAINVSKTVNDAAGSATAVVEIDVIASGEASGPIQFVQQAKFRISLLAGRTGNIRSKVATVTQDNDQTGGSAIGNVLLCQVSGTSTTAVTIQLQVNTAFTSATVAWAARLVSTASPDDGSGRVFSIASA